MLSKNNEVVEIPVNENGGKCFSIYLLQNSIYFTLLESGTRWILAFSQG
jgi:hypothetical protein